MLELELTAPTMKKYRKYLQRQNTDDDDITTNKCNMASAQNSVQNPQTKVIQHNHIIIKYQQPPDPAIINHVLELLIETMRNFSKRNPAQTPYTQDYIDQIIPLL